MELTAADVAVDHALWDNQVNVTIQGFEPTSEVFDTATSPVKALRLSTSASNQFGGTVMVPDDSTTFSILKTNYPKTPTENDRINIVGGLSWRVIDGGVEECTFGTRWRLKCTRAR